jgi:hypothetical protein
MDEYIEMWEREVVAKDAQPVWTEQQWLYNEAQAADLKVCSGD